MPSSWDRLPRLSHPLASPEASRLRASGWVALAVTRQGSHGPGRACMNASGSSADSLAIPQGPPRLSERVAWTGCGASMCPPVSRARVCRPALRFPPQGPPGRVPLLRRYYQSATTPCRPSRRTSLASLGGTSCVHSFGSLPGGRVRRRGLELVTRWLRPGCRGGGGRISQVPGGPRLPVCPVQSTPAGPLAPDRYGAAAWPLVSEQQRLPRKVFRRSLAANRQYIVEHRESARTASTSLSPRITATASGRGLCVG